ncbi:6-phosphogluconolactonase [Parvularcula oceani]|uniref:6-phosphogluconolactonase n=1 Tax=Parvularcula oceani TaxID=1247963 RepID=UPI0004E1A7E5|nr:6-phosphogluconolactonase [Parvularcula oceani]
MAMIESFDSRKEMTRAARDAVCARLRAGISDRGQASMALSGGSTPRPLYEDLSQQSIEWNRTSVTLADERLAPEDSGGRNEELVRKHFLRDKAAAAAFTPLIGTKDLHGCHMPFDVTILGMGKDGHTASLFPHSPGLKEALEAAPEDICEVTPDPLPEDAPWKRLTLSRSGILSSRLILLLVTGREKRDVLEEAMRQGQVEEMPVRAVLHAPDAPLRVLYAD